MQSRDGPASAPGLEAWCSLLWLQVSEAIIITIILIVTIVVIVIINNSSTK